MANINQVDGSTVRGIGEGSISQLNLDIFDSVEKINAIFSQMENLVDESTSYFMSDNANLFRRRFGIVRSSFPIVCQNLLGLVDDLNQAKTSIINITKTVAGDTSANTSQLESNWRDAR